MTQIKPAASLAGLDFQVAERIKNGGVSPYGCKGFLRKFAGIKFVFL
jgi:hypothetical protein